MIRILLLVSAASIFLGGAVDVQGGKNSLQINELAVQKSYLDNPYFQYRRGHVPKRHFAEIEDKGLWSELLIHVGVGRRVDPAPNEQYTFNFFDLPLIKKGSQGHFFLLGNPKEKDAWAVFKLDTTQPVDKKSNGGNFPASDKKGGYKLQFDKIAGSKKATKAPKTTNGLKQLIDAGRVWYAVDIQGAMFVSLDKGSSVVPALLPGSNKQQLLAQLKNVRSFEFDPDLKRALDGRAEPFLFKLEPWILKDGSDSEALYYEGRSQKTGQMVFRVEQYAPEKKEWEKQKFKREFWYFEVLRKLERATEMTKSLRAGALDIKHNRMQAQQQEALAHEEAIFDLLDDFESDEDIEYVLERMEERELLRAILNQM